jgi:hypothetical protein
MRSNPRAARFPIAIGFLRSLYCPRFFFRN